MRPRQSGTNIQLESRRPDLKQLVYSLCLTSDGAVPVHFKAYDGNQTDDGIHLETLEPAAHLAAASALHLLRRLQAVHGKEPANGRWRTRVLCHRCCQDPFRVGTFTEAVLAATGVFN
jgi:hypothetical protein